MCNERYFKVEFCRLRIWPGGIGLISSESLYYKVLLYWWNIWDKYQKNQLLNQHSSILHASLVEVSFLYWNFNFLLLAKARRQQNISVQISVQFTDVTPHEYLLQIKYVVCFFDIYIHLGLDPNSRESNGEPSFRGGANRYRLSVWRV